MSRYPRGRLATALCAAALLAAPSGALAQSDTASLQILGVNDFHGAMEPSTVAGRQLGGAAHLAAYLKRYEREHNPNGTLTVHAGDMVNASPLISGYFLDEPAMYALNEMGFDLGTLGNHEFDEGGREMLRLLRGGQRRDARRLRDGNVVSDRNFPGSTFPYIASNTHRAANGRRVLPSRIVLKRKGVRVGFVGVTTEDTPNVVLPQAIAPFWISDISDQVNREVAILKRRGVETIIVLAHSGGFESNGVLETTPANEIAQEATEMDDEVDGIIAGHTHSRINSVVDGKRIMSAFSNGTAFDRMTFDVDRATGDVVGTVAGEVVDVVNAGTAPDAETQAVVNRFRTRIEPVTSRVVGESQAPMTRTPTRSQETSLGHFIADAQRTKAGAQIALMNPGGIRADLDAGLVTFGELATIQPFDNALRSLELTGDQLRRILEQQLFPNPADPAARSRILQISGFRYSYDARAPAGARVVPGSMQLADGSPILPTTTYLVAANEFIASGGDGFTVFREGRIVGGFGSDLEALEDYVESLPRPFPVPDPVANPRITRTDP